MNIMSTKKMLEIAKKNNYAVPAFNIHNLETFQAVINGAVKMNSPVIIATTPSTVNYAGLEYLVSMTNTAIKLHNIPIALHLDHCTDIDFIKKCIKAGYRSVMIDGSLLSYEDNIKITKDVVDFSSKYEASVEGELGKIGGVEDDIIISEDNSEYTNPNLAIDFASKTNIDSLAIAIGTSHGLYKKEPKLDFDRLVDIKDKINIPLVLHGASGISETEIKKAVELGISKINIATELKIPFSNEIKKYFKNHPNESDPRKFLKDAKLSIERVVVEKIRICGSNF